MAVTKPDDAERVARSDAEARFWSGAGKPPAVAPAAASALAAPALARGLGDLTFMDVAAPDLNGVWRGKRLRAADARAIVEGGVARLPLSVLACDLQGEENNAAGLSAAGDFDGAGRALDLPPMIDPAHPDRAVLQVTLPRADGAPFYGDGRQVLARVLEHIRARGVEPVVALELEFYLLDPASLAEGAPRSPTRSASSMYALGDYDAIDGFLRDMYAAADQAEAPAEAALSEYGPFQFEVNLSHRADALRAADDAARLRWLIKRAAAKHGFLASFAPKLWADRSGCGQHVHVSLLDRRSGRNAFDDGGAAGSDALRAAAAGVLSWMPESTLIFAPNRAGYRRLAQADSFLAPSRVCWGYDSRVAALRVPSGPPSARRLEHRVPGSDANPYLIVAAILAAMTAGLEADAAPPPPVSTETEATEAALPRLALDWGRAIEAFEASERLRTALSPEFATYFAGAKRQEKARHDSEMSPAEFRNAVDVL